MVLIMKAQRHLKIKKIITDNEISTQEDLVRILNNSGFHVTQATVSRDIKEMKLYKVLGKNGEYCYAHTNHEKEPLDYYKFQSIFIECVISISVTNNLVVIKCYPGMASAACAAIDIMNYPEIVGTIAGDDTIFIAHYNGNAAIHIASSFKKILAQ